jgi:4-hydroxy-tetrahydrodipicolinate reductase
MADVHPSVGVIGLGRLGRAVVNACSLAGLRVVLTASRGTDWQADAVPDVIVDASSPSAFADVVDYCGKRKVPLVECVSNLDSAQWDALAGLARCVPVLRATNLAIGHYVQNELVRYTAMLVGGGPFGPEVSIWERHPATKAHRPSATAATLADTWAAVADTNVTEIGTQRSGLPVSDHELTMTWGAETLVVRHSVRSFDAAADGAVAAARWVVTQRPGLHALPAMYDQLTTKEK